VATSGPAPTGHGAGSAGKTSVPAGIGSRIRGQNTLMIAMCAGWLVSVATVTALTVDWWKHPML
jgi:hypothetical protein